MDNIWNPLVFKHHENVEFFKPIMHSFAAICTLLTGLGLAACILMRRWLVLLLDVSYYSVYIIAPAIMLSAFFDIIALIYGIGINIQKKTIHHVISPVIQIVISAFIYILLVPRMGLVGVGVAKLVSTSVSRIYKIAVGVHYYDTGSSETRNMVLCVLYVAASLCSLFHTSFAADLVLCLMLLAAMCVLTSKEWKPLYHILKGVLRKSSKEN